MEKYKEMLQTVSGFFHSVFSPVYLEDELDDNLKPKNKTITRNSNKKSYSSSDITILSWNILRNYNKSHISKSLAAIISQHNPSVILIQEASVRKTNFWDQPLLKQFNAFYAPLHLVKKQTTFYNFVHSGQLIISLTKLTKTQVHELPSVSRQFLGKNHVIKRIALYTQIKTKNRKTIGLYNLHLENTTSPQGRKHQIQSLVNSINKKNDDVVIIGGDFNTFLGPFETCLAYLESVGFKNMTQSSNPFQLDYFFVQGAEAKQIKVSGSGSDHQPIMITLSI